MAATDRRAQRGDRREGFVLDGRPAGTATLLRDLWRSRDLLVMLARKDFFVKYRRASFGILWAVLLPLAQAVVMAVVLKKFVRFQTAGSYTVFVFAGLLGWTFFSSGLASGTSAIVEGQGLSTKTYFPRALFPLVSVVSGVYGLVIGAGILLGLALALGDGVGLRALWLAPAVVLSVAFTGAASAVAAVVNVYARDVRYFVQAGLTPLLYMTPVLYPLSALPAAGWTARLVRWNPVTGIVELFRLATVGADAGWGTSVAITVEATLLLTVLAVGLYRHLDRTCVDLL